MVFAPRLDTSEPVGTRGEDEGQPHDGRPAATPSLPMALGRAMGIQDVGHAPFLEMHAERRESVYAFVGGGDCLAPPTS
jgi:hypothetical protein